MANLQQLIQLGVAGKLDQKQFDALPAEIRQALAQRLVGGGQPPPLPSELKDISHLFGAGTVKEQITTQSKVAAVGLFWSVIGIILTIVLFLGMGIIAVAITGGLHPLTN